MNGKTIALAEKTRNGGYVYAGGGKLKRCYGDGGETATGVTDSAVAKTPWKYPKLHPQLIIAKTATDGVRARAVAEYDRRVNEYNALNAAVNKVVDNGREAASRGADNVHLGYAQQEAPSLDENRMVGGRDVFAMHRGGVGFNARWLPKREAILNKNARDAGIELDPDNPMLNVEMWNMMRPRFNTTPDGRARIFREQPGGMVVTGGFTAFPTGVNPEQVAYGIVPAGSYYYSPDVTEFPETTGVHEAAHGLGHNKPQEIVIEKRGIKPVKGGLNAYIDKPTEIYSRLQELRSHYNLDPQSVQNDEDIQKLKADAAASGHGFDILNRYSDEDIKFLLNDVAMNRMLPGRTDPYMMSPPSGVEAQGRHLAANGGFLRRYDEGGQKPPATEILPEVVVTPHGNYVNYTGDETVVPTINDFFDAKASKARVDAVGRMMNTEHPVVPAVPNTFARGLIRIGVPEDTATFLGYDRNPHTCIATTTSQYDDPEAFVPGNKTFDENRTGFIQIGDYDYAPGDLVNLYSPSPYHSTMVTGISGESSYDGHNNPLLSYSNGGIDSPGEPTHMRYDRDVLYDDGDAATPDFGIQPGNDGDNTFKVFRYVGSPSRRIDWGKEYNSKYGYSVNENGESVTPRNKMYDFLSRARQHGYEFERTKDGKLKVVRK